LQREAGKGTPAADDFLYIAKDADGELFGMRKNPLASFFRK